MNGENSLPGWLRQTLIGIGLFFAGAVLAFGYSYRPLHGALTWKIEQLEARLDERNRENARLSDALARQKSIEEKKVNPETLAQVERELEKTKQVLTRSERDLKRAEKKRKEALASATRWRKRFEQLRDAPAPAPPPEPVASAPVPTRPSEASPLPSPISAPAPATPAAPAIADPTPTPTARQSPMPRERGIPLPSDGDPGRSHR